MFMKSLIQNQVEPAAPKPALSEEEMRSKVSSCLTKLLNDQPFWGTIALKLQPRFTRDIPVAAVTFSRELLLNPDWLADVSKPDLTCVILHEVLHPALGVFDRQGHRNAVARTASGQSVSLWNIAHDYAINLIIHDLSTTNPWISSPKDAKPAGLLSEKYRDWSAEAIYDDLLENTPQSDDGGDGDGSGDGVGYGDHLADVKPGEGASAEEMRESKEYWKQTLLQANMAHEMAKKKRGDLPGGIQKILDELLNPKVHWRDVLARWIGENGRRSDYTYRRPSRRSDAVGEILPTLVKHGVDDVCVLWDTSGSMNGKETEILSEIIGMCNDMAMKVRVMCCDMHVHSDQSDVDSVEQIDVKGGGGSDFCPAFARLENESYDKIVVAFTDGYIGVPEVPPALLKGVLWVLWEGDVDPTGGRWGEVLVIKDNVAVKQ